MEVITIIIALIVPIVVAIWTVRCSAEDTAKQIMALKQSATEQVESIKQLAKIQIKTTQIQLSLELEDSMTKEKQALKKRWDHVNREYGFNGQPIELGAAGDFYRKREEKDKDLEYEGEFYAKRRQMLMNYQKRLNELSKELEDF